MISQRKESIHNLLHTLEEMRQVKNNLALAIGSRGVEISMHAGLKSKAANEFNSKLESKEVVEGQDLEGAQAVSGDSPASEAEVSASAVEESPDKAVLLDALFAKAEENVAES